MKLTDKMFPLNKKTIALIEKQLKKEGIEPKNRWYKSLICLVAESEEGDTYFTIFDRTTKQLFTTCTIYNELDEFDSYIGEVIAVNRMGKNTDFQRIVQVESLNFSNGIINYTISNSI